MRRLSVCVCVCERVGVREKGRELHVAFRFYQISLNKTKTKKTNSINNWLLYSERSVAEMQLIQREES